MLVSLPLIQTIASSAVIPDLKFHIPWRWTVCPSLVLGCIPILPLFPHNMLI
jgi:hypothetical protein